MLGALVCFSVWAIALALALVGETQHTPALRIVAASLLAYAAYTTIRKRDHYLLLSPPLHMAGITLLFYVGMPLMATAALEGRTPGNADALIRNYPGSAAEILILGFVCFCIGIHVLAAVLVHGAPRRREPLPDEMAPAIGWAAVGCLAVLEVGAAVATTVATPEIWTAAAMTREVMRAFPAIVAFLVATVVLAWCNGPRARMALGGIAAVAGSMTLLFWNQAPVPLLILYGAALLFHVSTRQALLESILLPAFAAVLVLAIVGAAFFALRPSYSSLDRDFNQQPIPAGNSGFVQRALVVAEAKILQRQAHSAGCYQRIAERALDEGKAGNPLYFAVAVVPKALWPSKPNLSRGSEYAELCGMGGAIAAHHSESITIIGEPILEDGLRGLLVAEVTLGLILLGAAYFGLTGGPVRLLVLTALLPWLLAVEQHFAMYVGNVFKMTIIVLPFALFLRWVLRARGQPSSSAKGEETLTVAAPVSRMVRDGLAP